ncbi:hypothetical protein SPRG_09225 [Saprolegnia parasitica CBS 223.65]|uniref:MULE transposase domain-containing protein n=1 Tax=Saprolegnia parasitica (strain CBS 223.65) TaxID=695850 RepID=A0A067C2T4_SAPPC|nr:hypothetical protein SPRG_09225 [Saprolegnia parasitica CBS 223.65]KDO25084.1 hypothetical protein SPRG_09225 [Saprolegnia parasitica CBS 223.65]|eukprot:XP_012204158.1 hypothetical protein SPRG_09225 [Saprolegnia parasitica CBS 223.65]
MEGLIKSMLTTSGFDSMAYVREVIMDSTFNTNGTHVGTEDGTNPRYEIFVLMIPFRGEGYPIAYLYVPTTNVSQLKINIIAAWLESIREKFNLHPEWVHLDKCSSEIGAVDLIWAASKMSLCLWHVDQAIRRRFQDSKGTTDPYNPTDDDLNNIPLHVISFPDTTTHHKSFVPHPQDAKTLCNEVVAMMKCHYLMHALLDPSLKDSSPDAIYRQCLNEMYEFCCERGLDVRPEQVAIVGSVVVRAWCVHIAD